MVLVLGAPSGLQLVLSLQPGFGATPIVRDRPPGDETCEVPSVEGKSASQLGPVARRAVPGNEADDVAGDLLVAVERLFVVANRAGDSRSSVGFRCPTPCPGD